MTLGETGESGGFGVKSRNGFDQAGNGEGVADAALSANQVKRATLPGERDGNTHQRRNPGTINLWNSVQVDDDVARAFLHHGHRLIIQVIARIANGKPAVNRDKIDAVGFTDGNFEWWMQCHRNVSTNRLRIQNSPPK